MQFSCFNEAVGTLDGALRSSKMESLRASTQEPPQYISSHLHVDPVSERRDIFILLRITWIISEQSCLHCRSDDHFQVCLCIFWSFMAMLCFSLWHLCISILTWRSLISPGLPVCLKPSLVAILPGTSQLRVRNLPGRDLHPGPGTGCYGVCRHFPLGHAWPGYPGHQPGHDQVGPSPPVVVRW